MSGGICLPQYENSVSIDHVSRNLEFGSTEHKLNGSQGSVLYYILSKHDRQWRMWQRQSGTSRHKRRGFYCVGSAQFRFLRSTIVSCAWKKFIDISSGKASIDGWKAPYNRLIGYTLRYNSVLVHCWCWSGVGCLKPTSSTMDSNLNGKTGQPKNVQFKFIVGWAWIWLSGAEQPLSTRQSPVHTIWLPGSILMWSRAENPAPHRNNSADLHPNTSPSRLPRRRCADPTSPADHVISPRTPISVRAPWRERAPGAAVGCTASHGVCPSRSAAAERAAASQTGRHKTRIILLYKANTQRI